MAMDLYLIAIPLYETLEKLAACKEPPDDMLLGLQDLEYVEEMLLLARENYDDVKEKEWMDIMTYVQDLTQTYPGQDAKPYRYHSRYLGYSTLDFLISKHCNAVGETFFPFFEGKRFVTENDPGRIHYLDSEDVQRISGLLSAISFKQLLEQYDYEEVRKNAYKPVSPVGLEYLEEEYQELVSFFEGAAALKAYIVIIFN